MNDDPTHVTQRSRVLARERGPLSPDVVAAIGEQVLSALTAAHQAGIVHRDLTSSPS